MQEKKLQALLNLLDDKNDVVYNAVYNELVNAGNELILILQKESSKNKSQIYKERIDEVIEEINFNFVKKEIKTWVKQENNSLLYGAFLIAKIKYPFIKFDDIEAEINKITEKIESELNVYMTAIQQIKVLNFRLYRNLKFKSNFLNPESKKGAFINNALKSKQTNHMVASIIYSAISTNLGIYLKPVNFPNNALLALEGADKEKKDNIIFYINPFNNGIVITKTDIKLFLKKNNITAKDEHFYTCDNITILKEYVKFLIRIFKKSKNFNKYNYNAILKILTKNE